MATLGSTLLGALRYQGREGQLAWLGHRLSGLGTLLFFVLHVIDTATVYFFPAHYGDFIALYQTLGFQIGEMMLMVAVIFHAINGLRIILMDRYPALWHKQRVMSLATFFIVALLSAPAVVIMGGHAIENLGLFQ